jgi:hypothetical protein
VKLTRKQVLAGAAGAALGAGGVYELVDRLAGSPGRTAAPGAHGPEQHLLSGVREVRDNGVEVLVPPLHHQVTTARVKVDPADLADGRQELERVLAGLDADYAATPTGLGVTLAWGKPYFERLVPRQARAHLPWDRRAQKDALLDAIRFPSDPEETVLEENDVAILLRSDSLERVGEAWERIRDAEVLEPTSIRKGFAGGGFDGATSLPKRMAMAAGVPGADLIPETSELFLGFTSTQKAGLGPARIANLETLGYADLKSGYFRGGTHMHLSHIEEDLEAWFLNFDFRERVDTAFRPHLDVSADVQTVPQAPDDVVTEQRIRDDFKTSGRMGHSAAIQITSRLQHDVVADDGTVFPKGTAVPQRADFNTLDNPFFWSAEPGVVQAMPMAGVHFVVFNPTSDDFHRNRRAMDGVFPDGKLPFRPRARGQGFNAVLRTTHRQNFLVPPRRHRSFPLAELEA